MLHALEGQLYCQCKLITYELSNAVKACLNLFELARIKQQKI